MKPPHFNSCYFLCAYLFYFSPQPSYAEGSHLNTQSTDTDKCFALNHLNNTRAPGQQFLSSSLCIWIKMHLDSEKKRTRARRKKEALKYKLVSPWYTHQFILPVCQCCHPSVTRRQWWSCLSFDSCGLLSGANQLLCMQCGHPGTTLQQASVHIKQVELVWDYR